MQMLYWFLSVSAQRPRSPHAYDIRQARNHCNADDSRRSKDRDLADVGGRNAKKSGKSGRTTG